MSPQEPRGAPIEELAGKSQIAGILATHSRGVDRADGNLLSSAYHPDAGVDYSFFDGPASQRKIEFVPCSAYQRPPRCKKPRNASCASSEGTTSQV